MTSTGTLLLVLAALVGRAPQAPPPDTVTYADRLYGRVTTTDGAVLEGFLRWDLDGASWADILGGYRDVPDAYVEEAERLGAGDRVRSVEVQGVRVSWDEPAEWPASAESGVRFGHVRRLVPVGADTLRVELRNGERFELTGGSTDLGTELRGLRVDGPAGRADLSWGEVREVELGPVPAGHTPAGGARLHGTVVDRSGGTVTGYLAWSPYHALVGDRLTGVEEGGATRAVAFADLAAVEPLGRRGVRAELRDGSEISFRERTDVGGAGAVRVSDPSLGQVLVPWDRVERVRFHPPARALTLEDFSGGRRLRGTAVAMDGARHTGWIRWDNDEAYDWELLDGRADGRVYDVEMGVVARIVRVEEGGARVTLRDGRVLALSGSNDVDEGHKGVFVTAADGSTVVLEWEELGEVVFDDPSPASGGGR